MNANHKCMSFIAALTGILQSIFLSATIAGTITGNTKRLTNAPVDKVEIQAFALDALGNPSNDIIGTATSQSDGGYTIKITDPRPFELRFFQNGDLEASLQRIAGNNDLANLNIVIPAAEKGEEKPSQNCSCARRGLFHRR
ncbi:MAG TPA: hypothetical protein VMJ32_02605 [Pirellulales bacterium]|nr:hypothetical protein [Pirellulales bacterium]